MWFYQNLLYATRYDVGIFLQKYMYVVSYFEVCFSILQI
uniref:Uncharacterized protein n=1 Tax=Arundo donax TaxID=35708 RepID=A0A0A9B5J1_ARUDO